MEEKEQKSKTILKKSKIFFLVIAVAFLIASFLLFLRQKTEEPKDSVQEKIDELDRLREERRETYTPLTEEKVQEKLDELDRLREERYQKNDD